MKTTLTVVFVIVAALFLGGFVGHEIGFPDKTKMVEQRERLLKLVQEYSDILIKTEKMTVKYNNVISTLQMLSTACCDAAEKALNERDACKKVNVKKRSH